MRVQYLAPSKLFFIQLLEQPLRYEENPLGEQHLNKRTVLPVKILSANPLASIPQTRSGWAEPQADYRFLAQNAIG